jgi:hypothetical protein
MEKILIISLFITVVFCVAKLVEMKFVEQEMQPLKYIIRDSAIVFAASLVSLITTAYMNISISDFMNVVTDSKIANMASTEVFTDDPGF